MESPAPIMKRAEFKPYTIVDEINDACDSLISIINVKRQKLMELLKEREKKIEDLKTCKERAQMEYPLEDKLYKTSSELWYRYPPNFAQKLYSHTYTKEREAYGQFKIAVKCDKAAFRQSLNSIIDVVLDVTNPDDMSYKEQYPHGVITAGCYGIGEDNYMAYGVAVEEESNQMFVADGNKRVVICSSETGTRLQEISTGDINPWGIAVTPYSFFITSLLNSYALLKYSRPAHQLVKRVGREGSRYGEFNDPSGIAVNKESGLLYVCDSENHRITVHDTEELQHLYSITHSEMQRPVDIKLAGDSLYVLCIIKVLLFRNEDYICNIVNSHLDKALFFCIDRHNNFVISDWKTHNIKIFSPAGKLINTLCKAGHTAGELHNPKGICVTSSDIIICVSYNRNHTITILY